MTRNITLSTLFARIHCARVLPAVLCAALALTSTAFGQTSTKTLNLTGGAGFTGSIGGDIDITVQNGSMAQLDITDLDIRVVAENTPSHYNNLIGNSTSNNNTATTPINIDTPSVINLNIPTTAIGSTVSGSFDVTAGDNLANGVVGVLDGGVAGSDGAWDDPGETGILNNGSASNIGVALDNDLNAPVNVSGSVNANIPSDITIPNVVNSGIIVADLRLKNSSTISVNFEPVQSLSIQDLTFSTTESIPLNLPGSNFVEAAHPTGVPQLDLSASGFDLVETTISGTLVADLMGTINGSIDLAADVKLDLGILGVVDITTIDIDNAVDGELSDGVVSLVDINEAISLPAAELPFVINVLHEPTADVDFDDVLAMLAAGAGGLTVPVSLSELGVVIPLPDSNFELSNLALPFAYSATDPISLGFGQYINGTGAFGTVHLDHLAATVGGQFVLDLDANLEISAALASEAFEANAINVVPEPGSMTLLAFAGVGLVGYCFRRRRRA